MRWIYRILGALVVFVVIVLVGLMLLPRDRLAQIAADQISHATGRDVTITGQTSITFFPRIGIAAERITVAGPDWGTGTPMVTSGMTVSVDTAGLFAGRVEVGRIVLTDPVVQIETRADGRMSYDMGDTSGEGSSAPSVAIAGVTLRNGTVTYLDAAQTVTQLSDINLTLDLDAAMTAADLDLSATMNGQALRAMGSVQGIDDLSNGAQLDLNATVGAAQASFTGSVDQAMNAQGDLNGDLTDLASIMALLGQPAPELPAGVKERLAVKAVLKKTGDTIALADGVYTVGDMVYRGPVSVTLGDVPFVRATLDTPMISLPETAGGGSADAGASGGWSTAPLDFSGLHSVNAQVDLTTGGVDVPGFALGASDLRMTLDRGRLVTDILRAKGFEGDLNGQFVVNARGGLSMGGNLDATDIALDSILLETIGFEKLTGKGDVTVKFLTSGNSVDALMKRLSGTGSIRIAPGQLLGVDLAKLMGQVTDQLGGTTVFDTATADFTIENGVVTNSNLNILAQLFNIAGDGSIDLGARSINYLFTPQVQAGSQSITVPVRVQGSWDNLKIFPDLALVAQQAAKLKEAELKAEAQARLDREKAKLAERLAREKAKVVPDAGDLKSQAEDKLKEELQRGLGKLFGNN